MAKKESSIQEGAAAGAETVQTTGGEVVLNSASADTAAAAEAPAPISDLPSPISAPAPAPLKPGMRQVTLAQARAFHAAQHLGQS